jgi:hypothetical protein
VRTGVTLKERGSITESDFTGLTCDQWPKRGLFFHCGGEAAAVKNVFSFMPEAGFGDFPARHAKSQTSGNISTASLP